MNGHCLVGWDIGGAHLKAVGVSAPGRVNLALQLPAPIWHGLDTLHEAMNEILHRLPAAEHRHAVTMTGELADCFPDRDSGVAALLDCSERLLGSETLIYRAGGLCDLGTARAAPGYVASANWHAGAELAGQWYGQGVLVDIGSTTSDLVAIRDGHPAVHGYTDRERLQHDELVYTGVVRTPVMAVARRAPVAGIDQPLVAEQFAVMADVYRLTGELPVVADQMPTADGGPRDLEGSARRLARMAGADLK
ncbi:MAG: hydantoinase/oxoprolinase family protein [Gammaproteobacteria bacterium]|nr:hydantoinase/oxoprolinase family protein [Gammaproteobacteria bacterium]